MQGPRLSSHSSLDLPSVLPPNYRKSTVSRSRPRPQVSDASDEAQEKKEESVLGLKHQRWRNLLNLMKRHAAFAGPGMIASVAYIDPGNWATDLHAGSAYGYSHLFIVLLSGLIALLFQILSTRLGCVSGTDLALHCRLALHDRPRHKMFYRWGMLYPLYVLCESAIIFTDLAELLGGAIAINLLIPQIPLWGAVLLTSLDVLLILLLFDSYPDRVVTRSMRVFEVFIGALVLVVLGSFVALLVKVSPVWRDVFHGYVPGPGVVDNGALYIAVGILGATCMPHAFFIGSKMATTQRLTPDAYEDEKVDMTMDGRAIPPAAGPTLPSPPRLQARSSIRLHFPQPVSFDITTLSPLPSSINHNPSLNEDGKPASQEKSFAPAASPRPSLACVNAHLGHAVADVAGSLLGFATVINSAILILAAAVFYYGPGLASVSPGGVASLFDAFDLVQQYIGPAFAYLFAVALLASGQAASLTVTLAGQIISEGMIEWRTTPWKRRLITRAIGIVPSLAVAIAVGKDGVDVLLVGSQVALSLILPFVIAPLIIFTSDQRIMAVRVDPLAGSLPELENDAVVTSADVEAATPSPPVALERRSTKDILRLLNPFRHRSAPANYVSFANGVFCIYVCIATWCVVNIANIYAIIALASGTTGGSAPTQAGP